MTELNNCGPPYHVVEADNSYYVPYKSLIDVEKTMNETLLSFFIDEIHYSDIVGTMSVEERKSLFCICLFLILLGYLLIFVALILLVFLLFHIGSRGRKEKSH